MLIPHNIFEKVFNLKTTKLSGVIQQPRIQTLIFKIKSFASRFQLRTNKSNCMRARESLLWSFDIKYLVVEIGKIRREQDDNFMAVFLFSNSRCGYLPADTNPNIYTFTEVMIKACLLLLRIWQIVFCLCFYVTNKRPLLSLAFSLLPFCKITKLFQRIFLRAICVTAVVKTFLRYSSKLLFFILKIQKVL